MKYVIKTAAPSRSRLDLEADLNPQQRAVVEAAAGEILVLAGAGTGKTRALTYRVARLIASGTPPERILLCTFTNRAAREMVGRVQDLLGVDMRRCNAGTFHHVANRLLRRFAEDVGLTPDFGILDPEDSRHLLAGVIGELGLKTLTARRFPEPKVLHGLMGLAQGTRRALEAVVQERIPQLVDQLPLMLQVERGYRERMRKMNLCDFDDLLTLWHELVVDPRHASTAAALLHEIDHVLVDEYQDINALQGSICDAMAKRSGSLTCVGDDAQSIYSFRGADFAQIHEFVQRHPAARILELTINYRSTPEILTLANRSIACNRAQHPKQLVAVRESGSTPAVVPLRDVYQQAEFVAQRVLELHHEQGLPFSRMAVLYRNHSHSLELQVELGRRQIPFSVRSGLRFFEQAHIKDVVAYLRVRENTRDALAWVRLLKLWPGVGNQTAEKLAGRFVDVPAFAAADASRQHVASVLEQEAQQAPGRVRTALQRLAKLWRALTDTDGTRPGDAVRSVLEHHYGEYADRTFTNASARRDDIDHLARFADHYANAEAFLSELALVQGVSAETVMPAETPEDQLVLSTIHQAKGLEWPVCFLLQLAESKFPMPQSLRTPAELEEERRLFYVAVTRAASDLHLCFPVMEDGKDGPSRLLRPSRFLTEIDTPPACFERWEIDEQPLAP